MLDFGMPMGPLRLLDEVGLDVAHHICVTLAETISRSHSACPAILEKMLQAGCLGKKSGRGFYVHAKGGQRRELNPAGRRFPRRAIPPARSRGDELQERMVLLMVNEAARCLEERVVAAPEDVDFGMVMGTGFAPFRGGPLRYADSAGIPKIVGRHASLGGRRRPVFAPCAAFRRWRTSGKNFIAKDGTV